MTEGQPETRTAAMPLALAVVLGTFVVVSVLVVLAVGLWTGYRNTVDLLAQRAELSVAAAEGKLRLHMRAAEDQAAFLAHMIEAGEGDPDDHATFVPLLQGALAATPQISGLYFLSAEQRLIGAERDGASAVPVFAGLSQDPTIRALIEDAQTHRGPWWAGMVWRDEWRALQINFRHPVHRDGRFVGVVLANVPVPALSAFVADVEDDFGHNAFILVGSDRVLAHALLQFERTGLDRWNPMPTAAQVGDPVLMSLWDDAHRDSGLSALLAGRSGHAIHLGDARYVFIYTLVRDYGPEPWLLGTYLPAAGLEAEIHRLKTAVFACLAVLGLVIGASWLLGHRIALPARRLAAAARRVRDLDFDSGTPVPGSYFRELNDAARAFNAMRDGLSWFQAYVPKSLVRRLMAVGRHGALRSEIRPVSVLFTDIAGFTEATAALPAEAAARFLNEHFALVTDCVLAEGGTVDKYIGDSVMAFWGAPEPRPDHAAAALRTARAIAARQTAVNDARRVQGLPPIGLRIGVHCGPVLVGNIGTADRINYTIVGRPAIVASRIEQFGKTLPDATHGGVIALASETVVAAAGPPPAPLQDLGRHHLRGADGDGLIGLYRL